MVGFDGDDPLTSIKFWTGTGYDYGDYVTPENAAEWTQFGPQYAEMAGKWIDGSENIIVADVEKGKGFWIQTSTPSTIIFSGQVYTPTNSIITLKAGLNLVSNPFPIRWDIQNFTSSDLVGFDGDDPLTSIKFWTGTGYDYGDYVTPENAAEWTQFGPQYASMAGKWIDGSENIITNYVAPGKAFWIITESPATLHFTR